MSVYSLIVVDIQQADKGLSSMNDNHDDFLPGEISTAGLARIERIEVPQEKKTRIELAHAITRIHRDLPEPTETTLPLWHIARQSNSS